MRTVVLASGFNQRMKSITGDSSKALLPLGNRTILDYIIDSVPYRTSIFVTTNKKFERDFHKWRQTNSRTLVFVVPESATRIEDSPGTIGSLELFIRNFRIKDDLLVLATDNYLPGKQSLKRFVEATDGHLQIAVEEEYRLDRLDRHGVVKWGRQRFGDPNDSILEFVEKPESDPFPDDPLPRFVSPLCYWIPKDYLPYVTTAAVEGRGIPGRKPRGGDFIQAMMERGHIVRGFRYHSEWIRIATPADYQVAKQIVEEVN